MAGFRREKQAAGARSTLAPGTVLEGRLVFGGSLRVDGRIVGDLVAAPVEGSEVWIGPQGSVEGAIGAAVVVVEGTVCGPVRAEVKLEVRPGARVKGDLRYSDLQIHHGATVEGSLSAIDDESAALRLVANSRE